MSTGKRIIRRLFACGLLVWIVSPLKTLADNSANNTAPVDTQKNQVRFEGLLMFDASTFDGVYGEGESQTESQVRRATLGLSAELLDTLDLEVSAALEDGLDEAELKDALLKWKVAKRQRLIIGQQKEPVGLENNQSSKQIAAIERSMASNLFTPDRHIGLLYRIRAPEYSAAIGVFEADESEDGGLAFSGRATRAVLKDDTRTVHLGASASYRDLDGTSLKLKDEGGVNPAANIIDSKRYDVDTMQTMSLEAAWLNGPLSIQAEWFQTDMQLAESTPDPEYTGGYIQVAWLFGPARRNYSNGKFKLSGLKKSSAWEAVIRAGTADLRNDGDGVRAETAMAGLNYYKDKHLRVMAALLTADTSGPDATDNPGGNAATVRLQVAF